MSKLFVKSFEWNGDRTALRIETQCGKSMALIFPVRVEPGIVKYGDPIDTVEYDSEEGGQPEREVLCD